tara:strand:+ start:4053 stop:5606 length:1554 start_codon:yes stop_codon:yes gene_type:complete
MKINNKNFVNKLLVIFLIFFSIIFNQYYGYIGILPIDSFLVFNSGYDLMNGNYPFKDYWTIKEPFIDLIQAIFFKLFGVSWFAYVLHASIFNCIITISTFFILKRLNLDIKLSFFYSISVAILTYPTVGTPFSDHHTLVLCLLSFYSFVLAVSEKNNFYWFLTPILLGCSFMSKQAPTAYIIILISILSIIYFIKFKNFTSFIYAVAGIITTLIVFFTLIFLGNINFSDFFIQYFLYPQSIGSGRLEWLFPFEFKRIIWRFKLQYLSIAVLLYLFVKFSILKKHKLSFDDLIIFGLILFCILTIMHQLMTINAIYIYCLIPIFCGFSSVYAKKYLDKQIHISFFLIVLTLGSSLYYYFSYVKNRTFMDLRGVNLENSIDANAIHPKLSKIRWVTMFYPENPAEEVSNIKFALDILREDKDKKMIITDYQFISVFLNEYDFSPTRFWYDYHGYPKEKNELFEYWKEFVLKKIRTNDIKKIYVLKPLHGETKPLENVLKNCYRQENFSETFYKLILNNC